MTRDAAVRTLVFGDAPRGASARALGALTAALTLFLAATASAQNPPATTGAATAPPAGGGPAAAPSAAAAGAPGAAPRRSLIGARCADDAAKLCAGVEAGGGKLARCLRKHEGELSAPCKDALDVGAARAGRGAGAAAPAPGASAPSGAPAAPAAAAPMGGGPMHGKMGEWGPMHGMHKQCAADVTRLCKDVQPGHGRVAVCLNEHAAELAPGCKQHIETVMMHMNEKMDMHADCAADVQKLCSDVPAGQGRVAFCLGEHTSELSPACKKHVDEAKAQWAKRPKAPKGMKGPAVSGTGGAAAAVPPAPPVPPAPKM